jgi:18S rRNA (guanine1575-N7)-methyltransferase
VRFCCVCLNNGTGELESTVWSCFPSPAMLEIARGNESDGDLCLADMGQGFGFRTGMFDGVIRFVLLISAPFSCCRFPPPTTLHCFRSISALQWLFYSVRTDHNARKRLKFFFTSLYKCLKRGARYVRAGCPRGSPLSISLTGCSVTVRSCSCTQRARSSWSSSQQSL